VFLEANSFISNTYTVSDSYSNPSLGNHAVEGCSDGLFTFTLPSPATSPVTIGYTVSGTATNGTDYAPIQNSVTIPAGQSSAVVTIAPVNDGIVEGTESVIFSYMNGCTPESDTIYIVDNSPLSLNMGTNVTTCPGGSATISVAASGGVIPYQYIWSNSAGTSSSENVSPPATTVYTVTVTDLCGSTASGNQTVTISTFTTDAGSDQNICSGINAILTATNGGTYLWSNGGNSATISVSPSVTTTYVVTVTSAGCTAIDSVVVNVTTSPVVNAGPDQSLCVLSYQLQAIPSIGAGTWTMISGPGTALFSDQSSPTSNVDVTVQGSYVFSWTEDNNGCSNSDNVSLVFSTPPLANAGTDSSMCSLNCTLQAIPSVGTGIWTSSGPGLATFSNASNANTQVTVDASGTYLFIWTETNGTSCVSADTVQILFFQPIANAGPDIAVCQLNTSLGAIPSVGIGSWSQISGAGTASIADPSNPNTSVIAPLQGTYVFEWLETNGGSCFSADQVSVVFTSMPSANAGVDTSLCQLNYALQAIPSIGTGTWTYSGLGSASFQNIHLTTTLVNVSISGAYNFIWTEDNGHGCMDSDTVQVQLTQTPTSIFTASLIACFGDFSTLNYTGTGNAQSSYQWNFSNGNVSPGVGSGPQAITWNASGVYSVSLQVSLNGCNSVVTTLQVSVPPELDAQISSTDLLCNGSESGEIELTVTGGTPLSSGDNYFYVWSNGYHSEDITGVPQGFYAVTITDANGCNVSRNTTIHEPPQLSLDVTLPQFICPGATVPLTIYPVGGTFPYAYFWNGTSSAATITVSPSQNSTYTCYVTDANGCQSQMASTTVSIFPPMDIIAAVNQDSVCQGESVVVTYQVTGGAGEPYTVTGSDGNVLHSPYLYYPEINSSFVLTATDACPQTTSTNLPIFVYPAPPNAFLADSVEGCQPFSVSFIEINEDLGQSYVWDFGDNTNLSLAKNPEHTYTTYGTFDVSLVVTSPDGCKTVNIVEDFITVYPKPNALFTYDPSIVSIIKPIVTFHNISEWGYEYNWSFGTGDSSSAINPEYCFPGVGAYPVSLIAVSEFGCRDTAVVIIPVKDEISFYAPTAYSPDNDGTNDVFYGYGYGIDPGAFYLAVYDRWGQVIWDTKIWDSSLSRSSGWDGRNKSGNLVKNDTYTWLCVFNNLYGNRTEKAGTVTVIR
ncbi:MAG: hypothetical protein CVU05_09945, partial [Bacteroidetes bacterium HGW-Bacteroidetes-21]